MAAVLGRPLIAWLHRLRLGQVVREDGPRAHLKKSGTPTMGGLLIIAAALAGTVAFVSELHRVWPLLLALLGYSFIGLFDDLSKLVAKRFFGLKARHKLALQLAVAVVVAWASLQQAGPVLLVPFSTATLTLPPWLYVVLAVLTMVGASNAVNLTDGADGLAAGATAIASLTMGVISYVLGHPDVAVFCAAVGGACLGFTWFNAHPAAVIMGDTGALALGGASGGRGSGHRNAVFPGHRRRIVRHHHAVGHRPGRVFPRDGRAAHL